MKRKIYFIGLLIAFSGMWILNGCKVDVPMDYLSKDIEYGIGTWNADSLGNHRTVLSVIEDAKVVWAHIEWRRRDTLADKTDIIVIDAKTGERIRNVARANMPTFCLNPALCPESIMCIICLIASKVRSIIPTVCISRPTAPLPMPSG